MSPNDRNPGCSSPERRVWQSACSGFSLIEGVIVLALMLIMVLMLHSRGSRTYQQKQLAACERNLQMIHLALSTYAPDGNAVFPRLPDAATSEQPLSLLVPRYTTVTEIFICPGSKDKALPEAEPFADRKISYAYYMGWTRRASGEMPLLSDRQFDTSSKQEGQQIFSEDGKTPANNHNQYGGNVAFIDGSVQVLPPHLRRSLAHPTNITLLNPRP